MAHRGQKHYPRSLPFLLNRDGGDEQCSVYGVFHFGP
jgi:hypothetical protein